MRLQPFAGRRGSRRELFKPPLAKTTSPVIQPDPKKLLREGLPDNDVGVAVFVDIPSRYCLRNFSGFEGEMSIPASGEMKFDAEACDLTVQSARIQKDRSVCLVIAVQVGNGEGPSEWRREIRPRQGAFKAVLRPEARCYESQRGGKDKLSLKRSALHP